MHALRAPHAFDGTQFLSGRTTLLLEEDRIVGVETGRFDLPTGMAVADVDGTLLPGLIDCHSHLVADSTIGGLERVATMSGEEIDAVIEQSLRAQATAGVTTVRDLGDRDYRTLAFRDRPGLPRVVPSGPPLTLPGGHCHFLGGAVVDPSAAVAEHVERGVAVIKVMASGGFATPGSDPLGGQFTPAELTVVVEDGHRAGLPVVAHAHSLVGMRNAIAAGVDGIEHFTGLTADGPSIDDELLDEVSRRGIFVDPTMGNDRARHDGLPTPPALAQLIRQAGETSFDGLYTSRLALLTRLRVHDVRVISGVDSGLAPMKRHGNVWRTVGELVEAGYPPADALATVTSLAAEACGLAGVTGRLSQGLAADVLAVDGDLREDLSGLEAPRHVLVRGRSVTPSG